MFISIESKISAQPHTTLCLQFLDRENNDKNNTLPSGKQICFTIVWGCAVSIPDRVCDSDRIRRLKLLLLFYSLTSFPCQSENLVFAGSKVTNKGINGGDTAMFVNLQT